MYLGAALLVAWTCAPTRVAAQDLSDTDRVKWERQIDYLNSLITAEPNVPLHYMRMAQAYVRLGSEQRVLQYSDAAVTRGGNRLAADLLVGDFYAGQGRHADALRRYMEVLKEAPDQAHALTHVWLIAQAARHDPSVRLPVGLPELRQILNKHGFYLPDTTPGPPERAEEAKPRIDDGNRRLQTGDFDGAIRAYEEAAAIDAWNPSIYRGMGIVFARMKDHARAVGAYQLYIALVPPDKAADVPKLREIIFNYYQRQP